MIVKLIFVSLLILLFKKSTTWCFSLAQSNNACQRFQDYYHPEKNENCFYDPDATMETSELIKKYFGNVVTHEIVTEDGYILTLFQIPRQNRKGIILIHHSIATYSRINLWHGQSSIAFELWNAGYEIWLANHRGTSYSDKHVNMTIFDYSYWNFSFHEMGLYDVSSEILYISKKTNGTKLIFLGHSLGSSVGLIYSTLKPKEARKYVKSMILIAVPSYLQHITSPVTLFRDFTPLLKFILETLQMGSPIIILPFLIRISGIILRFFPSILLIASFLVWALCGYTPKETDPTFFNFDAIYYLNNFSWKTLFHYFQIENSGNLKFYDYGKKENLKIYGKETPPLYPLDQISIPILLVSSLNDSLITVKDSEKLFNNLPPVAKIYGHMKVEGLNHLDYYTGLHRKEIFVDRLINFLRLI